MVKVESLGSFRWRVEIDYDHYAMLNELALKASVSLKEVLAMIIMRGLVESDTESKKERE